VAHADGGAVDVGALKHLTHLAEKRIGDVLVSQPTDKPGEMQLVLRSITSTKQADGKWVRRETGLVVYQGPPSDVAKAELAARHVLMRVLESFGNDVMDFVSDEVTKKKIQRGVAVRRDGGIVYADGQQVICPQCKCVRPFRCAGGGTIRLVK
jgi:hypothetical protein